ncbi:MAG: hypothetical protein AAGN35_26595 [Bacteroidota bacterium]
MKKVTEQLREFDSQDAYMIHIFQSGNDIAVPYINLSLGEHPLNQLGDTAYVNQAVLLVRNLSYLKASGQLILGERPDFLTPVYPFGGINLIGQAGIGEFEFWGGQMAILLPDRVQFSLSPFPHPDPNDAALQAFFFLDGPDYPELQATNWAPLLLEQAN